MTTEFEELRSDIVLALRLMYLRGCSIPELLQLIQERLEIGKDQRVLVLWYLCCTFDIPLPALLAIGTWRGFSGGFQMDEEVDAILRPAIEAGKSDWSLNKN